MVSLSPRLSAVAKLVRRGSVLADVGCDHGFLPVYLLQNGIIDSAVASDINQGPLSSCEQLVIKESLQNKVKLVLSDGLRGIACNSYTDVTFCGMGGELISSILNVSKGHFSPDKHYIFNPMTHPEILRKYLCDNGFEIDNDFIVREQNHYYNVFDAYYTGKIKKYDESYYFLGNITDFTHKEYFAHLLNHLENKMKGGADYSSLITAIKEKL